MPVDVNTLSVEEAMKLDDEQFEAWCQAKKQRLLKGFSGADRRYKRRWANAVVRSVKNRRDRLYGAAARP